MSTKRRQEIARGLVETAADSTPKVASTPASVKLPEAVTADSELMSLRCGVDGYADLLADGFRLSFINRNEGGLLVELTHPDRPLFDAEHNISNVYRDYITDSETITAATAVLSEEIYRYLADHSIVDSVNEPEAPYDGPMVYSWLIPGERGYALEVKVSTSFDLETARAMALEVVVDDGTDDGRPLNGQERVYVGAVEPAVVRDTVDVTLDHQRALEANARLLRENEAFASAKEVFREAGIDPERPGEFVDRVHDQATGRIRAAEGEIASRQERLASALTGAIGHLKEVAVLTGFVPYEPPAAPEPDYSGLTIVVDDAGIKGLYPRLAGACWVERMPGAEMSPAARAGYAMTAGRLREFFRMKFGAGETEMAEFDAFLEYLNVEIGLPKG